MVGTTALSWLLEFVHGCLVIMLSGSPFSDGHPLRCVPVEQMWDVGGSGWWPVLAMLGGCHCFGFFHDRLWLFGGCSVGVHLVVYARGVFTGRLWVGPG